MQKIAAIAAIALLSLAVNPPANADMTFARDNDGNTYVYQIYGPVTGQYYGIKSSSVTANECGIIKTSDKKLEGASTILIDKVTVSVPNTIYDVPVGTKYSPCELGSTPKFSTARKTNNGDIYFPGYVPKSRHKIILPLGETPVTRSVTSNACGIAKFSNTESYPVSKLLSINGMPVAENIPGNFPPICKVFDGYNFIIYVPLQ
jgi:hypothetical protein